MRDLEKLNKSVNWKTRVTYVATNHFVWVGVFCGSLGGYVLGISMTKLFLNI